MDYFIDAPIHHIAIICSDYKAAKEFYTEQLGFIVKRETIRENDVKLDLNGNGYEIELFIKPNAPKRLSYPEACGLRHMALKVKSVADATKRLTELGIAYEPIRYDSITGEPMAFLYDPDGLPIEIHE